MVGHYTLPTPSKPQANTSNSIQFSELEISRMSKSHYATLQVHRPKEKLMMRHMFMGRVRTRVCIEQSATIFLATFRMLIINAILQAIVK
ncbi:hypothetical protein OPV22_028813 [Ensete ventricosum]|uniref:Uncharacterized protein n=1 Tax=Ensete ventricosum TaxID=4639 RepID=A0AAV8P5F7_ENSVE|nr:hypothetical protein OPV22_028813 [Ensete ventricosum]